MFPSPYAHLILVVSSTVKDKMKSLPNLLHKAKWFNFEVVDACQSKQTGGNTNQLVGSTNHAYLEA